MSRNYIIILLAVVTGVATACADTTEPERRLKTSETTVEVTPEFEVSGIAKLPDQLVVSELGLGVSSIELRPVETSDRGVAYVTSDPIQVEFDVDAGQRVAQSQTIILPETGMYDVTVRLEPQADEETSAQSYSLRMKGHAAESDMETSTISLEAIGETFQGDPVPLPLDDGGTVDDSDDEVETGAQGLSDESGQLGDGWTSFALESEKTVEHQLNRVELSEGKQRLRFKVDVHDWALDIVEPVTEAVDDEPESIDESTTCVDATHEVTEHNRGPMAVGDYMSVSTHRVGM